MEAANLIQSVTYRIIVGLPLYAGLEVIRFSLHLDSIPWKGALRFRE